MAGSATFRALWSNLDGVRAEQGLSYRALALRVNRVDEKRRITPSTLHDRMTSGRRVGWPELQLVVRALGQDDETWRRLWKQADQASRVTVPEPEDRTAAQPALAQLPADIAEFTGRERECDQVFRMHTSSGGGDATAVAISLITGMAGVGKTRLALHVAHRLRPRLDQVQLYFDLRGHAANQEPAEPGEALEALLRLLGVPSGQIPADLDARAALYRARLNGVRALVLLDDAASEEQVLPLLPGGPTCHVLITSRRALALDGVELVTLDVFPPAEAIALLTRIVGGDRVGREPGAADEIVRRCGCLPLAVALAARRLRARRSWTLADLARRLATEERRLGEIKASDRAVRGAFDISYRQLPAGHRRLFRRLGLHPGQDFTRESAAALDAITPDDAEQALEAMLDEHLLEQNAPGRFRFHDLLHVYARELARDEEPPAQRAAAVRRVLNWYLLTADAADRVLAPPRRHVRPDRTDAPGWLRDFAGRRQALDWCEAERANFVPVTREAVDSGAPTIAWQLPTALFTFFHLRGHRGDWITTHRLALAALEGAGDPAAEAWVRTGLGIAYVENGRMPEAFACFQRALTIRRGLDDRARTAESLNNLGEAYRRGGRYAEAIACFEEDLAICRQLGDRRAEGISLNNIGKAHDALGRLPEALDFHRRALAACREAGDRYAESEVINDMGETYHRLGRFADAVAHFERALAIRLTLGDRLGVATTRVCLGDALHAAAEPGAAAMHWRHALAVFTELGDPQAAEIGARLARL